MTECTIRTTPLRLCDLSDIKDSKFDQPDSRNGVPTPNRLKNATLLGILASCRTRETPKS